MRKHQKKSEKLTISERVKEFKQQNIANSYKLITIILSSLLVGIFFVGILIKPIEQLDEYSLFSLNNLNQMRLMITEKRMNLEEDKLYFSVVVTPDSIINDAQSPIVARVKFKNANSKNVQVSTYKGNNYYYEIVVSNIPKDWTAMKLELSDQQKTSQTSFIFNRYPTTESYKILGNFDNFSEKIAAVRSVFHELLIAKRKLSVELPKQKNEVKREIEQLQQLQIDLDEEMKYELDSEKIKSQILYSNQERQLKMLDLELKNFDQKEEEAKQKIELLEIKLSEFKQKNEVTENDMILE